MKTWRKIVAILFLLLLLAGFIVPLILPDQAYSKAEKRNLSAFPEFSLSRVADGSFMSEVEDYAADQFPLRDLFMRAKVSILKFLSIRESQDVFFCKDGSLIEAFPDYDAENLSETTASVSLFMDRHPEIPMYFLIAPTAVSVYPERLPANAVTANENTYIHAFLAALPANARIIDVRDAFRAAKSSELYYRSDHHWTGAGAYTAYRSAASAMGFEQKSFLPHTVCNSFIGSLAAKSGYSVSVPDSIELYLPETSDPNFLYSVYYISEQQRTISCYDTEKLSGDDPYQVFFGGNHMLIEITSTAGTGRNLLLFKDSYANAFIPFLIYEYDKITVVDPRYYYDDIDALVQSGQFTEVLFLYNASTLSEDTNLKTVLRNEQ